MKKLVIVKFILLFLLITRSTTLFALAITHITRDDGMQFVFYQLDFIDETLATPNPCYGVWQCYIGVVSSKSTPNDSYPGEYWPNLDVSGYKTMGEAGKAFITKFDRGSFWPKNGETIKDPHICGAVIFGNINGSVFTWWPNMVCRSRPPVELECKTAGTVDINYNNIVMSDVNNAKKDVNITLTCNMDTQVRVSASGSPGIEDIQLKNNGSLVAKMSVNDKRGIIGDVISVKKDQSEVIKISSVLVQSGEIEAGPFHGSGVLQVFFE